MYSKTKYTHYLQLIPLGAFFFGGESFADENNQNFYFQTSEDMLQQTSLLGLLRYQLLLQNNLASNKAKFPNKAMADLLVGSKSFMPQTEQSFGAIQQISPVFISDKKGGHLLPFSQVKYYKNEAEENNFNLSYINPSFVSLDSTVAFNGQQSKAKLLHKYNPKLGLEHGFREIKSGEFTKYENVFRTDLKPKIGIFKKDTLEHRQKIKDAEKEGFFKFQYKQLHKGFAFGCYASIILPPNKKLGSTDLVYLGKDRCPFKLEVKVLEDTNDAFPFQVAPNTEKGDLLWLLSDACINTDKVYTKCDGALTESRSFRCLVSAISDDFNYFSRPVHNNKKTNQMELSARYNLMKAGSLLSISDTEQLSDFLTNKNFNKIGYNHFLNIRLVHKQEMCT